MSKWIKLSTKVIKWLWLDQIKSLTQQKLLKTQYHSKILKWSQQCSLRYSVDTIQQTWLRLLQSQKSLKQSTITSRTLKLVTWLKHHIKLWSTTLKSQSTKLLLKELHTVKKTQRLFTLVLKTRLQGQSYSKDMQLTTCLLSKTDVESLKTHSLTFCRRCYRVVTQLEYFPQLLTKLDKLTKRDSQSIKELQKETTSLLEYITTQVLCLSLTQWKFSKHIKKLQRDDKAFLKEFSSKRKKMTKSCLVKCLTQLRQWKLLVYETCRFWLWKTWFECSKLTQTASQS